MKPPPVLDQPVEQSVSVANIHFKDLTTRYGPIVSCMIPVEVDVESDNHQPVRANGEGGPSHQRVSGTRAKPGTAGRSVGRASISRRIDLLSQVSSVINRSTSMRNVAA